MTAITRRMWMIPPILVLKNPMIQAITKKVARTYSEVFIAVELR
jgi:hypothetical protein